MKANIVFILKNNFKVVKKGFLKVVALLIQFFNAAAPCAI
jgi:hypothetical protein